MFVLEKVFLMAIGFLMCWKICEVLQMDVSSSRGKWDRRFEKFNSKSCRLLCRVKVRLVPYPILILYH
jgi:hypothetical protein